MSSVMQDAKRKMQTLPGPHLPFLHFAFCIVNLSLLSGAAGAQSMVPVDARQLVIPFENATREPRLYWLAEASAVALTEDLVALGAQAISRQDRLRAFDQLHVPPVATLSDATIIRIGQVLGAAQVVLGSFELRNDTLAVHARALRLDTGRMFPEIVEAGPLNDLFGIYARVARRIVPDSVVTTTQMEEGHPSLAAFEQYIKGELAENPSTKASFLKEALRLAPGYQRVRLALWNVYTDQGEHQQALDVVRRVPAADRRGRLAQFLAAVSLLNLGRNADVILALTDLNRQKTDAALLNNIGVA